VAILPNRHLQARFLHFPHYPHWVVDSVVLLDSLYVALVPSPKPHR
jgi:hypothetical protein